MTTLLHDVRAMNELLRPRLAALDPDAVPLFDAPALWSEFAELGRLAEAATTLLARRVDQSCTWRSEGFRSAAEQMASRAGTSVSAAKSMLETSVRVAEQPATAQALRGGLSLTKAALVSRAAEVAPEAERQLLELAANAPVAKVREACVRAKVAVSGDALYERARRERAARSYTDDENVWHFHAQGTVDDGATFVKVFEPIVDQFFKAAHKAGRREPVQAYAFDALIELARRAAGDRPAGKASSALQPLGIVRVDHAALLRGAVEDDDVCEIAGLGPIPVPVARDLLGDAVVKLVITKGVDVVNVTHLGRGPTVAQKVALWWKVPQCTALDCSRTQRIEFDHREEWRKTHHTRLDDGDGLCGHCHDLKTYFGWKLVAGTGKRPLVPPEDPRHPDFPRNRPPPEP